jgi:glycine cleavage system T protein
MRDQAHVVIIGAGIVGCSLAYYLTQMGWRDVVVLEQGPLFENWGSTSHAPGLMFQHNNSKLMCNLAQWSVELYTQLQNLTPSPLPVGERGLGGEGQRMVWQVGSLEIAHTPERWHELKRKIGNALAWGLEAHLVTPNEVKRMVPIMRTDDLYGAFYVPSDCDVKAAWLCETMAHSAQARGAEFYAHTPVMGIEVSRGRVQAVQTLQGRIRAAHVVCAAGLWGPVVGRMAGVTLPMTPCQHLYVKTAPLTELKGETEELRHPIVRYQDKDLYYRQHGEAYGFGSYRHEPLLVPAEELPKNDHPAIFPFTPEHFEESFGDSLHRFPCFQNTELVQRFNGLFSFTPDGNSLLGESADVRGFWGAEAVWVTHAGGVGRAVAEWMVNGSPSIDLREADINRFHAHALSRDYLRVRAERQYIEVYDIIHPLQQMENPRNVRVSPFHARLQELGAVFFESAGWEKPQWFEKQDGGRKTEDHNIRPPSPISRQGWAARYWSPLIADEHHATRERVGMFDLTAFTKLEVTGPNALSFLQHLAANQMDQPIGKVTYTSLLNDQGGIECDLTVTRLGEQRFLIITGAGMGMHDLAWLKKHLDMKTSEVSETSEVWRDGVHINDLTSQWCSIGVWGPRARDLVQRVTKHDVSHVAFPYLTAQQFYIGYIPVLAIRISYAGELGWEIYTPMEYGLKLWDTLGEAGQALGVMAVGGGAFDSLRLEKGYRFWGADIHSEYNPYEAGLGFAVRMNKGDFIGRAALERIKAQGVTRKLCALTFDDPQHIVMGKEPILAVGAIQSPSSGDESPLHETLVLGYVTSANFGYTIGKSIAYGYLPISHATAGTPVEVYYFGERFKATVTKEPLYDAEMTRLKS